MKKRWLGKRKMEVNRKFKENKKRGKGWRKERRGGSSAGIWLKEGGKGTREVEEK